jgi:hypothetical protein
MSSQPDCPHEQDDMERELRAAYDRGWRDGRNGRFDPPASTSDRYSPGASDSACPDLDEGPADQAICKEAAELAAEFEAATARLLQTLDETLADLRREREQTRAVMARLRSQTAEHG